MSEGPYRDYLELKNFAPLKRNHACLQCRKRKAKCDGVKPICSPCMRGHVRAIRSVRHTSSHALAIECTYVQTIAASEAGDDTETAQRPSSASIKHKHIKNGTVLKAKHGRTEGTSLPQTPKENVERKRYTWDALHAKIAELEARLAAAQTPVADSSPSADHAQLQATANTSSDDPSPLPFAPARQNGPGNLDPASIVGVVDDGSDSRIEVQTAQGHSLGGIGIDAEVNRLLMIPAHWPDELPAPVLFHHLVQTFFDCVPSLTRMIHRATFMDRLRLPPTHPDFPHASLLHAICAAAATHTTCVASLHPEALERMLMRVNAKGMPLELFDDFGLAQAYAAKRAIDTLAAHCTVGNARSIFQITQASVILSDLFFHKGMPLQAWLMASTAPRLIKSLEMGNRNHPTRYQDATYPPQGNSVDREERLATLWLAYTQDAGFSMVSHWSQSMHLQELLCQLPTSSDEFCKRETDRMAVNPQTAHSPNVLNHHPVTDAFVLVIKASILMSRSASWLRIWHQREMKPGDGMEGISWPSYQELIGDILSFQNSVFAATRDPFDNHRMSYNAFETNRLLVHFLPNVALCLLREPFATWRNLFDPNTIYLEQSCQAVLGIFHQIPSDLDVSLVMTPLMAVSTYTVGRIVGNFALYATMQQQYSSAIKYRLDLATLQGILSRYGQKHALGIAMSSFLEDYVRGTNPSPGNDSKGLCQAFAINSRPQMGLNIFGGAAVRIGTIGPGSASGDDFYSSTAINGADALSAMSDAAEAPFEKLATDGKNTTDDLLLGVTDKWISGSENVSGSGREVFSTYAPGFSNGIGYAGNPASPTTLLPCDPVQPKGTKSATEMMISATTAPLSIAYPSQSIDSPFGERGDPECYFTPLPDHSTFPFDTYINTTYTTMQ